MPAADLALFRAFPALRDALPRGSLLAGPTPVGALALPDFAPGSLYLKHDERSAPGYGGNTPRKFEFLLAGARARGSRRLVTTGGLDTNHGLATTIHGARAGLATTLATPEPKDFGVRRRPSLCRLTRRRIPPLRVNALGVAVGNIAAKQRHRCESLS